MPNNPALQGRLVVLHDPKAIHTVMVKDQEIWPKGLEKLKYDVILSVDI